MSKLDDWIAEQKAKRDAYTGNKKKGIKAGRIFSENDLASTQFQIYANEAQWQHEEDMYNEYQSPAALMSQYQDAGLNPALMYGQSTTPSPVDTGGTDPEVSSGQGGTSFEPMEIVQSVLGMLSNSAQVGAGISDTISQIQRRSTENKIGWYNAETGRIEADNDAKRLDLEREKLELDKLTTQADIAVKNALTNLYGEQAKVSAEQVKLISKQIDDLASQMTSRQFRDYLAEMDYLLRKQGFDFEVEKWETAGKQEVFAHIAEMQAREALAYADAELKDLQGKHLLKEEEFETQRIELANKKLAEQQRQFDADLKEREKQRKANERQAYITTGLNVVGDIASTLIQKPGSVRVVQNTRQLYDKHGRKAGTDTYTTTHYD